MIDRSVDAVLKKQLAQYRLFREKGCMRCHAVWGQGGDGGPDLGRTRTLGHATAAINPHLVQVSI